MSFNAKIDLYLHYQAQFRVLKTRQKMLYREKTSGFGAILKVFKRAKPDSYYLQLGARDALFCSGRIFLR